MLNLRMTKGKKILAAVFVLLVALSTLFASLAFFTDRANKTTTIKVSTFNDDGYSIEQQAPEGWFVAGETLEVQIKESNEKEENITSQITMRIVWDSPVDDVYPWGNDDSAENAVITFAGEPISYSSDGEAITFTLPKTLLNTNKSVENLLEFQIPSDLASTGRLYFSYEKIELSQYPNGWTASYDGIDLSELSFDVGVIWNVSSNQSTKDVVAYLTDGATTNDSNYGLCVIKAGSDTNTNNGVMMDWSAAGKTPWADYSITDLSIGEKVATIGDYAFAGELGITSVSIPASVTDIGISAFDGSGLTGTLTIPATVKYIDSLAFGNLQSVNVISFGHSSTDSLDMADTNSSSGAFYAGLPYTPTSPLGTTVYSENNDILDYAWNLDARGYTVTVKDVTGATVSASPTTAIPGKSIALDVTVSAGYEYTGSEVTWNSGNTTLSANELTFSMPAANVTVSPNVSLITYTIHYETNGGTLGNDAPTSFNVTTDTFVLPEPTRAGYTFDGWYENSGFSGSEVTQIDKGTTGDKTFYAKWTANTDTPYTVYHWTQNLNGGDAQNSSNYTLADTDHLTGTTDTKVTPDRKTYTGFTAPSGTEITIAGDGTTELNYYYTRNSYTFTLGSCNGVSTSGSSPTGSYKYEAIITLRSTTSVGYTWSQWISGNTGLVANRSTANTTFTMPASDISMTPSASLNSYSITYFPNGGTLPSDAVTSYTVESSTITLPTPTKTGYNFGGWYENSSLSGTEVTHIFKSSTGDKTFYAKWTPKSDTPYTVCHWKQALTGGSEQNETNYTLVSTKNLVGITDTSVTPAVMDYSGFTSPTPQTVTIAADGSTVVNYYYTRSSYSFILGSCNGVSTTGSTSSGTYRYGYPINLESATQDGYTWVQWLSSDTSLITNLGMSSAEFTMPAGDITMTPNATLISYSIDYELNGGTQGSGAVTSYTVESTVTLPTPTRTGYTFAGWYEDSNFSGSKVSQIAKGTTGNKMFYAKWTPNSSTAYTVNHYQQNLPDDGYTLKETEHKTGTTGYSVTPAVKTYTGFTSPNTETVTIAADGSTVVDYYYTRNSYKFTLGTGTGVTTTGSTATGNYKYGATITLKASANTGYTWSKWTSSTTLVSGSTTANTTFVMPDGAVTMTPSATLNTYTIDYKLDGGTQGSGAVTSYNVTTATFSLPTPTKTGYTFAGWYENSDLTGTAVTQITKGSTGNKTFYAKWTANTNTAYTVQHWQQTLTGGSTQNSTNYVVKDTENLTGTTGVKVTPAVKTYTGFTSPATQTVTIAANGSTVVNYYYTRNSYTFTLGSNDGVSTSGSTASGTYRYGYTITLKATASTGYTWNTWTSGNTSLVASTNVANTTITMPAGNLTMTPSATLNTYTISYELNGGTQASNPPTSYTVTTATFSLPTPTKTGYTFVGWYENSGLTGSAVTQIATGTTGNKTFYAKWEASTYTVKYDANGGSGTMTDSSFAYDANVTLKANTFTRSGYSFIGWAESTNGEVKYADAASVKNLTSPGGTITLYAQWHLTPVLAAQDTWYSQGGTSVDRSSITSIDIVTSYTPSSYVEAWDASDGQVGSVTAYLEDDGSGNSTYKLTIAGNGYKEVYANKDASGAFYEFESVTEIAGGNILNMSNVENASYMFNYCTSLESIDVSNWNISNLVNATGMFGNCYVLEYLDVSNWDTANIKYTYYGYWGMFSDCNALANLDVSNWNTSNMTEIGRMFYCCNTIDTLDVSGWDTSKVTDMQGVFSGTKISSIAVNGWVTDQVTTTEDMFAECENLMSIDLTQWDVSSITNMSRMFSQCSALTSIDVSNWDESIVVDTFNMFGGCTSLTEVNLDGWNMSHVVQGTGNWDGSGSMFARCTNLTKLTLPASFTQIGEYFATNCPKLTTIEFLHDKDTDMNFPTAGYNDGAFYIGSATVANPLRTYVITTNTDVLAYDWATDLRGYLISVNSVTGGTMIASPTAAINGQTVTLTPYATSGYTYNGATVTYSGGSITLDADTLTFTMPAADVTITPIWSASTSTSSVSAVSEDVIMTVDTFLSLEPMSEDIITPPDSKQILADGNLAESIELPPQVPDPIFIEAPIVPIESAIT